MGSFTGKEKLGGVRAFAEWESFLDHTEKPDPKQVYRRACREISANGKFGEWYLKVHGASAWQLYLPLESNIPFLKTFAPKMFPGTRRNLMIYFCQKGKKRRKIP